MSAHRNVSPTQARSVQSFEELTAARFEKGINAFYWPRWLTGDFAEILGKLKGEEDVQMLSPSQLESLALTQAGALARQHLLADLERLQSLGCDPQLNAIRHYPRDALARGIATDVYSFHVDSAPCPAETWLCTYHGETSQILAHQNAQQRVKDADTRAHLLRQYGGQDDEAFAEFLAEHSYDLHYTPLAGGQPVSMGLFHLWRIAVQYPGSPVPACIHRAPEDGPNTRMRLLLIA